jgi:hypothetical protein
MTLTNVSLRYDRPSVDRPDCSYDLSYDASWGVDVMFMQNRCRLADVCACDVSGVSMRLHGDVRETVGTL